MGPHAPLAIIIWSLLLAAAAGQPAPNQASGPAGLPAGSAVRFASTEAAVEPIEPPSPVQAEESPALPEFTIPAANNAVVATPQAALQAAPQTAPLPTPNAWDRLAMESPAAPAPSTVSAAPPAPPVAATPPDLPVAKKPLPIPRSFPAEAGADHARRLLRAKAPPKPNVPARPPGFGLEALNLPPDALGTTGAALGIVVGVLLLAMWCLKRSAPRSTRPLPSDVVMVLGQVRLAGKQTAQLMKIGSKLVLVNITPDGAKPITEITDPEEVARVLGMCEQSNPNGATAAFQEIFDQLTREPAHGAPMGGLTGDEPSLLDRRRLADAYANTPGGRAYG